MSRMTLKMVLFDLDGTLLPMVMDEFTGGYFKMLAKKLNPYGYEHQSLVKAIWHGTAAMVRNDGSCRNEDAFWKDFSATYGEQALKDKPLFDDTETRIRWTGLEPEDFEFFTTYENICWCKPNPDYYREVLRRAGLKGEDCLMVGNDVGEDMIAASLGMKVFLLTDCLINKAGEDINRYPHGGFDELRRYVETLIEDGQEE